MSEEPENLVLQILRQIRAGLGEVRVELGEVQADVRDIKKNFATKADLRSEINSLHADFASDLLVQRKEFNEQFVGLRRAVVEYHSSVIGHGILISELEERVRRVERHLDLPPLRAM